MTRNSEAYDWETGGHTRALEYPMLKDVVYLDHAGSTPPAKSLLDRFATNVSSTLYSNPHSQSSSSQLTSFHISNIRLRLLSLFGASPTDFDLVFTSNTTAAIKLVAEAFRGLPSGFRYVYHESSHTSLVGVREEAAEAVCVEDEAVEDWIEGMGPLSGAAHDDPLPILFAFPAQSHMDGRRFPLSWTPALRSRMTSTNSTGQLFTLVDAASFAATSPLDLGPAGDAPDFTVLSLHKIFGFPDLGALIVRKKSAHVFTSRRYFGGGTVEAVVCGKREQWHSFKQGALHERLEDGTLPFHSIIALDAALDVHAQLFGSMARVAMHTSHLARRLRTGLKTMKHANGRPACVIYTPDHCSHGSTTSSSDGIAPVVAFNLRSQGGAWISITEFEKLATIRNIHIRTGSLCCPGGSSTALGLEPWEVRRNFSAGARCGTDASDDVVAGKPTGMIRASLGAMNTADDVDKFLAFVTEFFVETVLPSEVSAPRPLIETPLTWRLRVETLYVYPIKSCGAYRIPANTPWEVRPEGLAWDREWCIVHAGSGKALNQKQHPRMALLKPTLDFGAGMLRVTYDGPFGQEDGPRQVSLPLSANPNYLDQAPFDSQVCGDAIVAQRYTSRQVNEFFEASLGVSCCLARFPSGGNGREMRASTASIQKHQLDGLGAQQGTGPAATLPSPPASDQMRRPRILLSNESAMLMIYTPSVASLNQTLLARGSRPVAETAFRANVVLAPLLSSSMPPPPAAYSEDFWQSLTIGQQRMELLGACRRCHMVCVDQATAKRNTDVFVALAKTRRFEDGKTYFGVHMTRYTEDDAAAVGTAEAQFPTIMVGDEALAS